MFRTRPRPAIGPEEPNLPERVEGKETNPSKVDFMEQHLKFPGKSTRDRRALKGGELIK